jgi:hypothetical protein
MPAESISVATSMTEEELEKLLLELVRRAATLDADWRATLAEAERRYPEAGRAIAFIYGARSGHEVVPVPTPGAIWTDKQVEMLKARQADESRHPYTCPGEHPECAMMRNLIPTTHGWICACGRYTQDWSHETGGPRHAG